MIFSLYSHGQEDLLDYLKNNSNLWSDYERANNLEYYNSFNLFDNRYLVLGKSNNFFTLFITDAETFVDEPDIGTQIDFSETNFKIENLALFISDLDYDGKNDIVGLCQDAGPGSTYLTIYSVFKKKTLLESEMQNYSRNEYQFSWIDYCIVNGKRGIRVRSRGESRLIDDYYFFDGKKDHFSFFYWSPSEQRYILDEKVTQAQIKNAIIPEDYFAYNGLKFSSLDKKLKKSDLENLDAAQLRLMRNAVYARHGKQFKSVDLQSLWECYTWYKVNPDYNDSLLTTVDKYNIKLIQEFEGKKKQ
ncbi:MAG: YARHG domain-containing protein [Treponema sp.]|nr:YARHG domain-containing protein [Treponema sp.]